MKTLKTVIFACLFLGNIAVSMAQKTNLKFEPGQAFKIVQFTDIHYRTDTLPAQDAIDCMNKVLDIEKPDLVVVTGDVIFGRPAAQAYKEALAPIVKRGLPFVVTFGNHDDEFGMSRQELLALLKTMPGNLTDDVTGLSGVSNVILKIQKSNSEKTAAVLYCIDSNSYSELKSVDGYGWIRRDQVNWYAEQSAAFTAENGGKPLPALSFFHIALPEFHEAVQSERAFMLGSRKEEACSPKINTGLFQAMLKAGDVMGVFVGHDHVNDYLVDWKGIALTYGRFTGGNTVYSDVFGGNGARIIELTENAHEFTTWIRLRTGEKIDKITYPTDIRKK